MSSCGEMMFGKCSVCGEESNLSRKYFYYGIKCECCSNEHFEIIHHCEKCTPVAPKRTLVSLKARQFRRRAK